MKAVAIILLALVASAAAGLRTLARTHTINPSGEQTYSFTDDDGTVVVDSGSYRRTLDGTDNVLVKSGSFRYVTPDGVVHQTQYTADEFGFHPISSDIPTPVQPNQPRF